MNWLAVLKVIRTLAAVMFLVAEAFQYGRSKYGDDSWKVMSPEQHVNKAVEDIQAWLQGERKRSVLVDAALRLMFAAHTAITSGMAPKEYVSKDAVETKSE